MSRGSRGSRDEKQRAGEESCGSSVVWKQQPNDPFESVFNDARRSEIEAVVAGFTQEFREVMQTAPIQHNSLRDFCSICLGGFKGMEYAYCFYKCYFASNSRKCCRTCKCHYVCHERQTRHFSWSCNWFIYTDINVWDSFLRGNRMDNGEAYGLELSTFRDSCTIHNSASCCLHVAGWNI